jgi:predicted MFS family arabinose efflux permease
MTFAPPPKDSAAQNIFRTASFAPSRFVCSLEGAAGASQNKWSTALQQSYNRIEKNWVLGVTSLASFMMALDSMIVTTAFAAIRADFASPVETLQWAINAFNLTFAVLLLTGAALGDRFGRRRVLAAGIGLFVVASAACALSANAGSLIAARARRGLERRW